MMHSQYPGLQGDAGGEVMAPEDDPLPPLRPADIHLDGTETSESDVSDMETDEVQRDFIDDPDERITNPTLYLRKFWRMVSPQPPIYHCYRNAAKRSYSCNLTLTLPPKGTRAYKAPAAYPSKRAAKRAVSEFAIASGILDQAKQSMVAMDRVGTDKEPVFRSRPLPKRDERFNVIEELSRQEEQTHSSSQNPVTALNLAVQRYCIETPAQALLYAHESAQSSVVRSYRPAERQLIGHIATANYRLHGCTLTVRITPDLHEPYSTAISFTSAKVAKEAATRLALQDGVVTLLKLHNSFTSKVCRQLGKPIPSSVEDHDPVDEENTAGMLGQLVQEVTRNPQAMQCEYTTTNPSGTELHGAILSITMKPGETKTFQMTPCTKSKKDAKEAVCRLAVKSGMYAELQAQRRLIAASTNAMEQLGPKVPGAAAHGPPKAGTVSKEDADYLENAVAYLNLSMQAFTGKSDALSFGFTEMGPSHGVGRTLAARFGCSLTVYIRPQVVRKYSVEPHYPTKKAAKESVAKLAVKEGVVEVAKQAKNVQATSPASRPASAASSMPDLAYQYVRATPAGYPSLQRGESAATDLVNQEARPYSTRANERPIAPLLATQPAHEVYAVSPPPYSSGPAPALAADPSAGAEPAVNPLVARQQYLPQTAGVEIPSMENTPTAGQSASSLDQRHLSAPQSAAEAIFVNLIEDRALNKIGALHKSHTIYGISKDRITGTYGGTFTLRITPDNQHTFSVPATYASARMAREAVASKAVHGGVLALIDRGWGMPVLPRREDPAAPPPAEQTSLMDKKYKDGEDPHSQPVSYLHQICQVLLGPDATDRPRYELIRKEQSTLYGAILTINTEPLSLYKTDLVFVGKAAAKDAVSRMALEDNIIEKLKDTMIHRLAPNVAADKKRKERESSVDAYFSTPPTGTALPSSEHTARSQQSPAVSSSYVVQLDDYCKATCRPAADWKTVTVASSAANSESVETSVSVKIADETFELDKSKKGENANKEKLAKMVLKHLRKKDGSAEAGVRTVL